MVKETKNDKLVLLEPMDAVFNEVYRDDEQKERIEKVREASMQQFGEDEKPLADYLSKVFGLTLWINYNKTMITWVQQDNSGRFICIGKTKFENFAEDVGEFYESYIEAGKSKRSLDQFVLEVAVKCDSDVRILTDCVASELKDTLADKATRWTQLGYAGRTENLIIDEVKVIETIPF